MSHKLKVDLDSVSTKEYLLLIQHEICEASSTKGLHVSRMLLQNGTEIKYCCLSLAQQGITPRSLQQGVCCLSTLENPSP